MLLDPFERALLEQSADAVETVLGARSSNLADEGGAMSLSVAAASAELPRGRELSVSLGRVGTRTRDLRRDRPDTALRG